MPNILWILADVRLEQPVSAPHYFALAPVHHRLALEHDLVVCVGPVQAAESQARNCVATGQRDLEPVCTQVRSHVSSHNDRGRNAGQLRLQVQSGSKCTDLTAADTRTTLESSIMKSVKEEETRMRTSCLIVPASERTGPAGRVKAVKQQLILLPAEAVAARRRAELATALHLPELDAIA